MTSKITNAQVETFIKAVEQINGNVKLDVFDLAESLSRAGTMPLEALNALIDGAAEREVTLKPGAANTLRLGLVYSDKITSLRAEATKAAERTSSNARNIALKVVGEMADNRPYDEALSRVIKSLTTRSEADEAMAKIKRALEVLTDAAVTRHASGVAGFATFATQAAKIKAKIAAE